MPASKLSFFCFAKKITAFAAGVKTAWDRGKTMSDVIFPTSEIIQIISDLFSPMANLLKTRSYTV